MKTICQSCLMENSSETIFGKACFYCKSFKLLLSEKKTSQDLQKLKQKISKSGKNGKYNCIVGLSGGTDSSFALLKAVEIGLKPLAVHFDNGWNSSVASQNIYNLVSYCKVDLICHVADWQEFREYQRAFFHANVIDIELLTDNALYAINYYYAKKYGCKFILAGFNKKTEGVRFPKNWNWWKYDKLNILSIGRASYLSPPKSFPLISTIDFLMYEHILNIKMIPFLDYLNYDKVLAAKKMKKLFNFYFFKEKHTESTFTKIYQQEILPKKFNIDKRRPHFAALILTNQMKKNDAKKELKKLPFVSVNERSYLCQKLNFSMKYYKQYLMSKGNPHQFFKNEIDVKDFFKIFYKIFQRFANFS